MTFLNPLGFLALSLIPVIVLLYLRRVRRRVVPVSSLIFWQRALGEQRHRAFLGRLRQWLSLLLHLLILLLLILALVRPEPARLATAGQSTVVVIDARARMQAVEPDGRSRFEKALALARQTAAGAREGGNVAVLAAGADPEVVSPFTGEPQALAERLKPLAPTDATGDLGPTLALARELLGTRPGAHRLLLLTDGSDKIEAAPANAIPLETVAVGTPLDNVAITRFAARPELASPQTAGLLLEIANFGRAPAKGNVEIAFDGRLLDVKPFALGPGERKSDVFPAIPATANGPGKLTARLDLKDAQPLDNVAYAMLPAAKRSRVLLVTRGNWFMEKLLAADTTVKFELLEPESFRPEMAGSFDAVIYDDCGPETLDGMTGNALFLKSSPLGSLGTLKEPLVTDTEGASPLLRFVDWRNVTFLRATQIPSLTEGADRGALDKLEAEGWSFAAPLRSFDHPLILTGVRASRGEQRLAVFAFDVAETDLPLRIAFPLLVSNTVHWLAGTGAEAPRDVETGQAVELGPKETARALPEPAEPTASGAAPAATPAAAPLQGSLQPRVNGFYRIENPGGTRWVAANTFSEAESNLRAFPASPTAASGAARSASGFSLLAAAAARPLWQWFVVAAFALLSLEWWLFHRRRTE